MKKLGQAVSLTASLLIAYTVYLSILYFVLTGQVLFRRFRRGQPHSSPRENISVTTRTFISWMPNLSEISADISTTGTLLFDTVDHLWLHDTYF